MSATAPSPESRRQRIRDLLPELELIENTAWREAVIDIWVETWTESSWSDPYDCPKSYKSVPDRSNIDHTRSVTQQALAVLEVAERMYGTQVDRDVLIVSALLHDVSKLIEYEPGPEGSRASQTGRLVQHGVHAAAKAVAHGLPDEVVHVIVCHTHQSATVPATNEAIIIHYADFLDSDLLLLERQKPLFAKA